MLKMIAMAPVIMGCALWGTVGMINAINKFCPDRFEDTKTESEDREDNQ